MLLFCQEPRADSNVHTTPAQCEYALAGQGSTLVGDRMQPCRAPSARVTTDSATLAERSGTLNCKQTTCSDPLPSASTGGCGRGRTRRVRVGSITDTPSVIGSLELGSSCLALDFSHWLEPLPALARRVHKPRQALGRFRLNLQFSPCEVACQVALRVAPGRKPSMIAEQRGCL